MKIQRLMMISGLLLATSTNATPIQWAVAGGGNGHYYEYVSDSVNWNGALEQAASSSFAGMQGYLATITSQEEQDFLQTNLPNLAWIAGSDEWDPNTENDEGQWKWMAGPEQGQLLTYFSWASGEPNNCCGGEDYLQFHWASNGDWNDHGGPGNSNQTNGYLVEYSSADQGGGGGSIPEPSTLVLLGAGLAGLGGLRRKTS